MSAVYYAVVIVTVLKEDSFEEDGRTPCFSGCEGLLVYSHLVYSPFHIYLLYFPMQMLKAHIICIHTHIVCVYYHGYNTSFYLNHDM